MKAKYWLLAAGILSFASAWGMLGSRTDLSSPHRGAAGPGAVQPAENGPLPAADHGLPAGGAPAILKRKNLAAPPPEKLTESGVAIADFRTTDPEVAEVRVLAELYAESLRSPAYLQENAEDPSPSEDLAAENLADESVEPENTDAAESEEEAESEGQIALDGEDSAEPSVHGDSFSERPQLTESGVVVSEHEHADPAWVEARLMAEQLLESQRNPAYLRAEQDDQED